MNETLLSNNLSHSLALSLPLSPSYLLSAENRVTAWSEHLPPVPELGWLGKTGATAPLLDLSLSSCGVITRSGFGDDGGFKTSTFFLNFFI